MIRLFPGEFREIELREKYPICTRYNLLLRSSGYSYTVLSINLNNLILWMWYNSTKLNKYIPLSAIKELEPILVQAQARAKFGGAWFGGQRVEKPDILDDSNNFYSYDALQTLCPNAYLTKYDIRDLVWNKFRTKLYINNLNTLFNLVESKVQEFGEFTYYNM